MNTWNCFVIIFTAPFLYKAKTAASRDGKEKKTSDTRKPVGGCHRKAFTKIYVFNKQGSDARKPNEGERKEDRGEDEEDKGSDDGGEQEKEKDDKNVVFCMWGHENCKTR